MNYSIIIPYCDTPELLLRAIQSVPDRQDIEILVVDNGMTPLDSSVLSDRQNVLLLQSPVGKGAGVARNVGLSRAKGKWLLCLDADDYFTNGTFDVFDKYVNAKEDILFFEFTSCYSEDGTPATRHIEFNTLIERYLQEHNDHILRYEWTSPCGKMIRMQVIKDQQIRFEETHAANDVMFSLLTGHYATSVDAIAIPVYCATIRKGSLTTTTSLAHLTDRIDVCIRYNKFVRAQGFAKYQKSIMYYIYLACKQFGPVTAIRLFGHSFAQGNNPLIGMTRWLRTIKKATKQHQ